MNDRGNQQNEEDANDAAWLIRSRTEVVRSNVWTCHESTAVTITEGTLDKEGKKGAEPWPDMPLKQGGEPMDVRWARGVADDLRELLEDKPAHFNSLLKLVENPNTIVKNSHKRDLRKWYFLAADYIPRPDVSAVMKASLREVGDGYCIVDPLEAKTAEDAAIVQEVDDRLEEQKKRGVEKLVRRLRRDEEKGKWRG